MTIRVAINGYGRIGRNTLRAFYENGKKHDIEIVAINDLGDAKTNAHLTQYDTAHGKFPGEVSVDGDYLVVNGDKIRVLANRNPAELPWGELNVDVVMECTGFFTTKEKASAHIKGGAKKVIISAPGGKDVDATIVYGVNHNVLKASDTVISNASCTTNCLAPLVKPLNDKIGLVNGLMTTIHAYTNDQVLTDVYHEDLRRARSATHSQIPTKTGAASAVGLVLPELNGKLDGYAIRVPTINVSVVDLSFIAARDTTVEEVNAIMKEASQGALKGILGYNDVRLDADQGVGPSGEGVELVRQRVGLLEPHAGHGCGARQREVSYCASRDALQAGFGRCGAKKAALLSGFFTSAGSGNGRRRAARRSRYGFRWPCPRPPNRVR
jgi:glyceraldehyde 3-phosphate dehydrogenase